MDVYSQIALKIIQGQEAIIGPVAVEQAGRISGLQVDWSNHSVVVSGDENLIIGNLVDVYKQLFGQISVEVSKEAVATLVNQLAPDKIPKALK